MSVKPFQYCLQFFEPRELYLSEKRLQDAFKNHLWKKVRESGDGRKIQILSPGEHNHNEGPDFLDARVFLGERLLEGDIELHRHAGDWYAHGHHKDARYEDCILHVVFHPEEKNMKVRDRQGRELPLCYIPLEEVLALEPEQRCLRFRADPDLYFPLLQEQGRQRIDRKIRYFYKQHVRFPYDVMLYWGLFKACGYRFNEENMIRLFMIFPWEDYICGRLPKYMIAKRLWDLAGFDKTGRGPIRWTHSATRPGHYPEKRMMWLSAILEKYYGIRISEKMYDLLKNTKTPKTLLDEFFETDNKSGTERTEDFRPPGSGIRQEMILNTVLPLMEAIRLEKKDPESTSIWLRDYLGKAAIPQSYGRVAKFHTEHGIPERDKRRRNWLASQGVLYVQDHFCSQELQYCCPVCALADGSSKTS